MSPHDSPHRHQLTSNVKLLQKVALVHDGNVLLLKRSMDSRSRPGSWDLPGGNSEWPEVPESGAGLHRADAAREVREETGIELAPEIFSLETLSFFDTYFDAELQVFSMIVGFVVKLPADFNNQVVISHEHSEYVWAPLTELDNYDFGGYKGKFVKDIILNKVSMSSMTPDG